MAIAAMQNNDEEEITFGDNLDFDVAFCHKTM
jgi:hypothetical protein